MESKVILNSRKTIPDWALDDMLLSISERNALVDFMTTPPPPYSADLQKYLRGAFVLAERKKAFCLILQTSKNYI